MFELAVIVIAVALLPVAIYVAILFTIFVVPVLLIVGVEKYIPAQTGKVRKAVCTGEE